MAKDINGNEIVLDENDDTTWKLPVGYRMQQGPFVHLFVVVNNGYNYAATGVFGAVKLANDHANDMEKVRMLNSSNEVAFDQCVDNDQRWWADDESMKSCTEDSVIDI